MPKSEVFVYSPHARVLFRIGSHPRARLRDIAEAVGMTERNVQNLVRDLQAAGLVEVERQGRRNRYRLNTRRRVGQEAGHSVTLRQLLTFATGDGADRPSGPDAAAEGPVTGPPPELPESPLPPESPVPPVPPVPPESPVPPVPRPDDSETAQSATPPPAEEHTGFLPEPPPPPDRRPEPPPTDSPPRRRQDDNGHQQMDWLSADD